MSENLSKMKDFLDFFGRIFWKDFLDFWIFPVLSGFLRIFADFNFLSQFFFEKR